MRTPNSPQRGSKSNSAQERTWKSIVGVAAGNCLEMYDFMIFGYYAKWIAKAFFPLSNETASLLLTLATSGAGFLMRPLGAVVLGGFTDRNGRRAGLMLTLGLMAFGTATIAFTPGFATIGLAAPIIVVIGRLLQGLSAGAELGAVSVYLAEISPIGRKGLYVSFQSASQQISVMFAALIGLVLVEHLPSQAVEIWGWRLPLILGCAVIPFLFWIRRALVETSPSQHYARKMKASEVLRSLSLNWRLILIATLFTTLTTTAFYFITAYTPTFGVSALKLAPKSALLVTLLVGALNLCVLPTSGHLSDRIGRRPILWAAATLFVVTAFPVLHWLVVFPSFSRFLIVELWFALLYASYNGAMVVYLTEIMPPEVRATSFSLAYSTATALFGGFTPFICTFLIARTGNKSSPAAWLSMSAAFAICAVSLTYIRTALDSRSNYASLGLQ